MQTPAQETSAALVHDSALFDEEWYAAQRGRSFATRALAAADYVSEAGSGFTPHPLFEDAWLYPRGRWRRSAPDPLSFYLSSADERTRAPHPLLDVDAVIARDPAAASHPLGPVDHWLRSARPGDVVPSSAGSPTWGEVRATVLATLDRGSGSGSPAGPPDPVAVVVPVAGNLNRGVSWLRRLHRDGVPGLLCAQAGSSHRTLAALATGLPGIRVVRADEAVTWAELADRGLALATADVVVLVRPEVNPPRWGWIDELVTALDRPGIGCAQPLLLNPDRTVAAAGTSYGPDGPTPLLAGHPADDALRMADLPLPAPWPGVLAFHRAAAREVGGVGAGEADLARRLTEGGHGVVALAAESRLITPVPADRLSPVGTSTPDPQAGWRTVAAWRAAGFEGPGRGPIRVREGRPALRWSIDIAAPAWPAGGRWGDLHFARSLAAALDRLGQWVAIDHPETRGRASRELDDVVLTLRGLEQVAAQPGATNLLWIISHPEDVTRAECAPYDAVFAASTTWAAARTAAWGLRVEPLLQCTDAQRFHPGLAEPDSGPRVLFVGNSRGVLRPAVAAALETGLDLTLYGAGWDDWLPDVAGDRVANEELGALYASAGLVLNDHWDDMRELGFVSNRVFDVLACGARLLSDDVAGLADVLGPAVPVFRDTGDFARLTAEPLADHYPDAAARQATAERVLAQHSFDARAERLLDAALRLRATR